MSLSPSALRKAANIQEKILELQSKLNHILGQPLPTNNGEVSKAAPKPKKRKLSAAGLAAIRAGVRKRMARQHGNKNPALKPKRKVNAARSAAAKARWKAAKAAGKTRL